MPNRRGNLTRIAVTVVVTAAVGIFVWRLAVRYSTITLRGAVIRASDDPNKQSPIGGVVVAASDGSTIASANSDPSGGFALTLRRSLLRRHSVTLSFRHKEYKPFNVFDPSGDKLYVVSMVPLLGPTPSDPAHPAQHISNVWVRYTIKTEATVEIGSGVKTFQAPNKGNVPCNGHLPCSPDGKWKASSTSATLDAEQDNEFRNGRVSCIAGPCPFTTIERDDFSRGGRMIGVTVLNWSDTTTFLLQAEAVRRMRTESTRKSYPVIFENTMNFSLPAAAEGTCIEAEVEGNAVVFPIGPNLSLSWAECETQTEPENNKLYRCELRPGYVFR